MHLLYTLVLTFEAHVYTLLNQGLNWSYLHKSGLSFPIAYMYYILNITVINDFYYRGNLCHHFQNLHLKPAMQIIIFQVSLIQPTHENMPLVRIMSWQWLSLLNLTIFPEICRVWSRGLRVYTCNFSPKYFLKHYIWSYQQYSCRKRSCSQEAHTDCSIIWTFTWRYLFCHLCHSPICFHWMKMLVINEEV